MWRDMCAHLNTRLCRLVMRTSIPQYLCLLCLSPLKLKGEILKESSEIIMSWTSVYCVAELSVEVNMLVPIHCVH